jgi:hypothetical protein
VRHLASRDIEGFERVAHRSDARYPEGLCRNCVIDLALPGAALATFVLLSQPVKAQKCLPSDPPGSRGWEESSGPVDRVHRPDHAAAS